VLELPQRGRTVNDANAISKLLKGESQLGPYSMEKVRQVDEPATRIVGGIERFDRREDGAQQGSAR
jgi:hypothetical protein